MYSRAPTPAPPPIPTYFPTLYFFFPTVDLITLCSEVFSLAGFLSDGVPPDFSKILETFFTVAFSFNIFFIFGREGFVCVGETFYYV